MNPSVLSSTINPGSSVQLSSPMHVQGIWPIKLSLLGINEDEKETCRQIIRFIYPQFFQSLLANTENDSRPFSYIKIKKNDEFMIDNQKKSLPLSIRFLNDGQILLSPKGNSLIGRGAQTTVKKAWNLCTGHWEAKKNIINPYQIEIYKQIKFQKGCAQFHDFIVTSKGIKVLQPLYQCNLKELLLHRELSHTQKKTIFYSLLEGLHTLHRLPYTYHYHGQDYQGTFNHGDIKLANILVRFVPPSQLEIGIDDFGMSGKLTGLTYTRGYESPELCSTWLDFKAETSEEEIEARKLQLIAHNQSYGHLQDIWAMGLVLAAILKGELANHPEDRQASLPNLKFLISRLSTDSFKQKLNILNLGQNEIDDEIEEIIQNLPNTTDGQELAEMWQIVLGMLQVNVDLRINSSQALKSAKELNTKNSPISSSASSIVRQGSPLTTVRECANRSKLVRSQ